MYVTIGRGYRPAILLRMHIPAAALSDARVLGAYAIFISSYLVFALGKFPGLKIDRPGAAIIGAVAMVGARIVQPGETLRFIDFPTNRSSVFDDADCV